MEGVWKYGTSDEQGLSRSIGLALRILDSIAIALALSSACTIHGGTYNKERGCREFDGDM